MAIRQNGGASFLFCRFHFYFSLYRELPASEPARVREKGKVSVFAARERETNLSK
jgi:hypothetical protein